MTVRADLLATIDRLEATIRNLRATVTQLPADEPQITCPLCGLGRPSLAALANHVEVVHGDEADREEAGR